MKKITTIKILMFIMKLENPNSLNLLIDAVERLNEIREIFRMLEAPEHEIEEYVEDYINRVYISKINNMIIYSSSS